MSTSIRLTAQHPRLLQHSAYRQSQIPLRAAAGDGGVAQATLGMMGRYPLAPAVLRGRNTPPLAAASAATGRGMEGVADGEGGVVGVELTPGDCLYIPPYWAHAVLSVDASVSLAAFSTSWEQARWARSGWRLAPLGRFAATPCSRARGAALAIGAFLRALLPALPLDDASADASSTTPRRFLAGVYATRFAPLDAPAPGPLASPLGRANGSPPSELADCLAAAPQSGDGAPEADPRLRLRIDDFAQSVAVLLTQPDPAWGGRRFERGVAVELAADYVEELAGWGAGGAEDVRRLLQLLLTMDPEGGGAAVHDSLGWG